MKELLINLCEKVAVSGYEADFLESLSEFAVKHADKVYFDRLGNLVCFKKGRKKALKKILFAAHADEVGMVVKSIEKDGTLLFDSIGILPSALPTKRVFVGEKKLCGVIGAKPIHLLPKEERAKNVTEKELFIDIGAGSKEEAEKHIKVGDFVSFNSESVMLSDKKLKAKAIDDRAGCAVLLSLMSEDIEYDTWFAFTRREELGTIGAIQVGDEVCPDICVVCEATTASDIYGTPDMKKVVKLSEGVASPFMDGGTLYSPELYALCRNAALEKGIKWQTKTLVAGGTDARSFQRSGHGCRVLGLAIPCRYIHTSGCVCDLRDLEAQKQLAKEMLSALQQM